MREYRTTKESTYYLSAIMVLSGVVILLSGKLLNIDKTLVVVLEVIGATLVGIFGISLIYERFVAEKHFENFKGLLANELRQMDSIQSKCLKLGISEIFETRNTYEMAYPLMKIIEQAPDNSKITCIARTLFHLLNKTGELKRGMEKGLTFELACVNPDRMTPTLEKVSFLYKSDVDSALSALKDLVSWAVKAKARGSIELSYHEVVFPDSVLIFTSMDGKEKLVWDLSFGRDLTQKTVLLLGIYEHSLGNDLKNRYVAILGDAACQIRYSNGNITKNEFGWEFGREAP